jgi:hypothetical protein
MKYLTILKSLDDEITTTAGGLETTVFPYTKLGVEALRGYASEYTSLEKLVESGDAGLFMAEAGSPIELPFEMNLNYVDLKDAKKLDPKNLERAIQILSQYDSDAFMLEPSTLNHDTDQLNHILSSIAVTIGSVVSSEAQWRDESIMANQVLITRPTAFVRIPQEQAVKILAGEQTHDPFKNQFGQGEDGQGEDDRGQYGMGGDWWKNPQEAVKRIAKIITEDPDLFD